jgi:hypothetical protein
MRRFKYLAAVTALTGLLAGSATVAYASAASAATSQRASRATAAVSLTGGATTVTTAPGVAPALLSNGIVPLAIWPASQSVQPAAGGSAVRLRFPVTGGHLTLNPLAGQIGHSGGILFLNARTGREIEVSQFIIDLTHADLTGVVNGNPGARVALFNLDLSHATLVAGHHTVQAGGIVLTLTSGAATALDAALGTKLFRAGLKLGTASTYLYY